MDVLRITCMRVEVDKRSDRCSGIRSAEARLSPFRNNGTYENVVT